MYDDKLDNRVIKLESNIGNFKQLSKGSRYFVKDYFNHNLLFRKKVQMLKHHHRHHHHSKQMNF